MSEHPVTPEETEGVPEYEVGQYLPRMGVYDETHRALLREKHGYIRTYFKARSDRYRTVQRWMNQARMSVSYDAYLARATTWAILLTLTGILVGIGVASWLSNAGMLAGLQSPVSIDSPVVDVIAANKVLIAMGIITVLAAVCLGAITFAAFYYYPWFRMDTRRRNIDVMLPHGIVFMYALSSGGMNVLEVCKELAAADDAYNELANEFDMIVRDVELFGNDLITALRNARNTTPSHRLEQFLDDMISVSDVGGDASSFFEQQSKRYLTEARDAQSDFLETLALLAEVFIVLFVAGPLFAIVTLILVSLLGGETVFMLQLFIYGVLPLAMAGFVVLVAVLSDPYVMPSITLDLDRGQGQAAPPESLADEERLERYQSRMRFRWLDELRLTPIRTLREEPLLTLLATVPVGLIAVVAALLTGQISLSWTALVAAPYQATIWLGVVPLLIVTVPLSVFHELRRGHEALVTRRVPVLLDILSSANNMGIAITDALGMVSRWVAGPFAEEIVILRNDIEWNHDLSGALLAFGNRMRTPQLSRTLKLLAEGARATANLGPLLAVAAEDTRNRYRMAKQRESAMGGYIAVVVISFIVYLLVVTLLEASYLTPMADVSDTTGSVPLGMGGLPVSLAELPVEQYRLLFFHSALIQGVGTGLLAGKLSDNRLLTGLKYSITFVLLTIVVFSYL